MENFRRQPFGRVVVPPQVPALPGTPGCSPAKALGPCWPRDARAGGRSLVSDILEDYHAEALGKGRSVSWSSDLEVLRAAQDDRAGRVSGLQEDCHAEALGQGEASYGAVFWRSFALLRTTERGA